MTAVRDAREGPKFRKYVLLLAEWPTRKILPRTRARLPFKVRIFSTSRACITGGSAVFPGGGVSGANVTRKLWGSVPDASALDAESSTTGCGIRATGGFQRRYRRCELKPAANEPMIQKAVAFDNPFTAFGPRGEKMSCDTPRPMALHHEKAAGSHRSACQPSVSNYRTRLRRPCDR